jgi:hypothetical protein
VRLLLSPCHTWLTAMSRLKRLITSFKIFGGLSTSPSLDIRDTELQSLSRPPVPSVSPFIQRSSQAISSIPQSSPVNAEGVDAKDKVKVRNPSFLKLIRPLLAARAEAMSALGQYLDDLSHADGKEALETLRRRGAKLD